MLAGAFGFAACTSSPDPAPTPTDVVEITDQPGSVDGYVGARDDVVIDRCERNGDAWGVEGTVTNPTSDLQDYRIYVSLLDGDDTVGLVQVDLVGVEGGGERTWSQEIEISGDDLACVLRVERFTPSS